MKSSPVASFVAIFSGPATLYFRDGDESGISAPMQSNGTAFGRAFVSDMLANVVELAATMDESWAAVCAAAVVCALAVVVHFAGHGCYYYSINITLDND